MSSGESGVDAYIEVSKFHEAFAGDVRAETAAIMAATQRPQALASGQGASVKTAWQTIPSWYLVATSDKAIPPEAQRFMAKRAGSTTIEVDASHVPMISRPDAVAGLIKQAIAAVA